MSRHEIRKRLLVDHIATDRAAIAASVDEIRDHNPVGNAVAWVVRKGAATVVGRGVAASALGGIGPWVKLGTSAGSLLGAARKLLKRRRKARKDARREPRKSD